MKDRILQIMKNEGMTQQEFSRATGISAASLSSIFNGRTAPTMKHAEALHRHFPHLSMPWLLFGEGEMLVPVEGEEEAVAGAESGEQSANGVCGPEDGQFSRACAPASMPASTNVYGVGDQVTGQRAGNALRAQAHMHEMGAQGRPGMPSGYPPSYAGMSDLVNYVDKKPRKIVEIRIFFDDGTFETFKGN